MEKEKKTKHKLPSTFRFGAVCIAFLIIGYQVALFVKRAAQEKIEADRDAPDTVWLAEVPPSGHSDGHTVVHRGKTYRTVEKRYAEHSPAVEQIRERTRRVESFRFNPNTASAEEFQRLGFSQKQAQSIINYREKGGRFRRREDFAKSFVVADSVYRRLEKFITIPKTDINLADSAAFDDLPGIGGYFAAKMIEYRRKLGGYSYPEQLMDIYHFDREKFDGLKDLIVCSEPQPYDLWGLPAEELRKHPYIGNWQTAKAIVFFREHNPADSLNVKALERAGILSSVQAGKLSGCRIKKFSGGGGV